jgi:hypothetical protein
MRGRITLGLLLGAAILVGCASDSRTAEQKREAKRMEQARREQEKLEEQARKDEERAEKKRAGDRKWELGQHMFRHEDEPTLVDAHAERYASNGAAYDASFSDVHFDGGELNALGRSKLGLLLSAAATTSPVTVYVAGDPNLTNARLASLNKNWKSSKYPDIQLTAKEGRNPLVMYPAWTGLRAVQRVDKEKTEGRTVNVNMSGGSAASVPNTRP